MIRCIRNGASEILDKVFGKMADIPPGGHALMTYV